MDPFTLQCPIPISDYPQVLMAHGGGGKLMAQLIDRMFAAGFDNEILAQQHDGATFDLPPGHIAFTTDSFVVNPIFFPGGDIGHLAVNGTVNDLAMCGARPFYLSVGFILEEGLPMETLWRVVRSMRQAAQAAGVQIVTGDTKVVDRGKGDGIFINTTGVGVVPDGLAIGPRQVQPGDAVLLNGDIGRHGMAIMAVREGLAFESDIESDTAPVAQAVQALLDAGIEIHCLRDLTRGGLTSALVEIAETAALHIHIEERAIQVQASVQGACELLGLDPLYVANEGRFAAFVAPADAERAREILQKQPGGNGAAIIGQVVETPAGLVSMRSKIGANRILDRLSGEQLPRIC